VATIRYLVLDVDDAVAFYTERLGFTLERRFGPPFAVVRRGDLALWLSGPQASAARALPDGRRPEPGGWNRLVLEVDDLAALVAELQTKGVRFRSPLITGPGGSQILAEDPSGNPVELFQASRES
jgi:catechol 2,3-dioxygenase-like lactoylglutathione lyase family enzyme